MAPTLEQAGRFAAERVRTSLGERYEAGVMSRDLWRAMGREGFLGVTVPGRLGGSGGGAEELARLLSEFTYQGCDLGLTLSWVTHLALCEKSIETFGTDRQKREYLPRLASGEWIGAAAVSEPKTGAHPGGLRTTARRTSTGYMLDGTKMFVTDGPVADLFVVVAVTDESEGRSELTAFLVEADLPGVSARPMDLNFLKTSPHGEITFDGVEVGEDAVLGKLGEGHSGVSRTAFARERSMVLTAFPGLFSRCAREVAAAMSAREGSFQLEGMESYSWMHHLSALDAYSRLSTALTAAALESPSTWAESMDTAIYLGISYSRWVSWITEFAGSRELASRKPLSYMLNDMKLVVVGEGILLKEGRKRYITGFESR